MPAESNTAASGNKCDNCNKTFQSVKLKTLQACAHLVCPKCNPANLRKQGKLEKNQLCPVCAKRTNIQESSGTSRGAGTEMGPVEKPGDVRPVTRQLTTVSNKSECAICTEHLKQPLTLPCEHRFCKACYEHWEERSSTCPLCRAIVDEAKHQRILEDREARRLQRRARSSRRVQPPFPDPLFNARTPSAVASTFLLLPTTAMLVCGIFAVRNCHKLMFTGFPFWTAIHLLIIVVLSAVSVVKHSVTTVIVQIVLAAFGIMFCAVSLFLATFQLDYSINEDNARRCDRTGEKPVPLVDISLICVSLLALINLLIIIFISMVTLGANPGFCCLKNWIVPDFEHLTNQSFMHYRPGNFFPEEPTFTEVKLREKIINEFVLLVSLLSMGLGIGSFYFCHSFRATGVFIWSPLIQVILCFFHIQSYINPTWCRLTTSMIMASFQTLCSFVVVCFAGAQLSLTYRGERLEACESEGPVIAVDVALVVSAVALLILNFLTTRYFSNHLVTPNRIEPSDNEANAQTETQNT